MPGLHIPPLPFDSTRAARILEELSGRGLSWSVDQQALLNGVFGNSPFLGRLALREPETLARVLAAGPDAALQAALARAEEVAFLDEEMAAMAGLRRAKREAALAIAMADIAGWWNLDQVTGALTRLADDLPLFAVAVAPEPTRLSEPSAAEAALRAVNPDELSPKEALELLYKLRGLVGQK